MSDKTSIFDSLLVTPASSNSQVTVLAPTGTIAFMMDCDTTGVEPDIALVKYKKLVGGGMMKIVNQTVPMALAKLGYSPAYSTEAYLMSLAASTGKPIAELEGVEAQFDLLDAPAWPEQVDFLRQAVGSIFDGEAAQELRALVAAWRSSDAPAMQGYLQRVSHSPDPVERAQFDRLITARNAGMADKIDRLLQDRRFYLIAVGTLHCFGDSGLVEALRARGYVVTPVQAGRPGH